MASYLYVKMQSYIYQVGLANHAFSYETIMFGRVTHTLDAAAMRVHSLFYFIHIL